MGTSVRSRQELHDLELASEENLEFLGAFQEEAGGKARVHSKTGTLSEGKWPVGNSEGQLKRA